MASLSRPIPSLLARWGRLSRDTLTSYLKDHVPRLSAALAFYTAVATVPLIVLTMALGGAVLGRAAARRNVLLEVEELAGVDPGKALDAMGPLHQPSSTLAWVSLGIFLVGGFGLFSNLRHSLNYIWKSPRRSQARWWVRLRRQLFSGGAVLGTGLIVLVSLTLSAVLTWILVHASRWGRWPALATRSANLLFSFTVVMLLIAVVFKMLPNVAPRWGQIWRGAAFTSLLFTIGKTILAQYFAHVELNSLYGSASTVIALLLWCYYAAQIVFLGAEFTRVYSLSEGGRIALKDATVRLPGSATGSSSDSGSRVTPNGRSRTAVVD
jgi:membrane protein